jgi:peptidoglycan/xylan/chitin deacetylase (PgdA/CDA1 family)
MRKRKPEDYRGVSNYLKLKYAATFAKVLVIVVGLVLISPIFLSQAEADSKQKIMLSFSVFEPSSAAEWCTNLSIILNKYGIAATVFIVGKVAEQYPQTVTCFNEKIDIGSQTFSGVNLTSILDYSVKLQEIQQGKIAVDNAGNMYSKVFRAPYGATDEDIYSLLYRSNITADFSYESQYNLFYDTKFVKMESRNYEGINCSPEFINSLLKERIPIIITFEDACSTSSIDYFLSTLERSKFDFLNASELTGYELTIRGE